MTGRTNTSVRSFPVRFHSRKFTTGRVRSVTIGRSVSVRSFLLFSVLPCQWDWRHPASVRSRSDPTSGRRPTLASSLVPLTRRSGPFEASVRCTLRNPVFSIQGAGEVSNPCSNVPTTKCITLCTCVSIFLQTFSRVLALH